MFALTPFLDLSNRTAPSHSIRAAICFWAEFVFRVVVVIGLLLIAVAVAWKVLAPLPRLR